MKTVCFDKNGNELYTFQGIAHHEAEVMLQNDLRVYTYKVLDKSNRVQYVRR